MILYVIVEIVFYSNDSHTAGTLVRLMGLRNHKRGQIIFIDTKLPAASMSFIFENIPVYAVRGVLVQQSCEMDE